MATSPVCFFEELTAEQAVLAGGKGRTLARLHQAGHPVPPGLVVLTPAFDGDVLIPAAWERIVAGLARMRAGQPGCAFAVRSSALAEDSAQASFAGEFETVLNVRDDAGVREAIDTVRRSRHAERVVQYSQAQGLGAEHPVAVVIQRMVSPDFSGVLFTADPVTGNRATGVGNFVRGLGEKLVSGEATAETFTLDRLTQGYSGGPELRRFAPRFLALAERLERELGGPQDLEWALAGGKLWLLQARPITTLCGYNPRTGERNDSLTGEYLWTSTNLGEAVPGVMTPLTWSFVRIFIAETLPMLFGLGYPPIGNLGGRFYMNLSLTVSLGAAFGRNQEQLERQSQEVFGVLPRGLRAPRLPLSRWGLLRRLIPAAVRLKRRVRANARRLSAYLAAAPARCEALHARLRDTSSASALLALWEAEVRPALREASQMLEAGSRENNVAGKNLRRELIGWVGEADASALLSGLSGVRTLASLETLVGLAQLARGEIDRETYLRRYGHRGPDEFEVSLPRPAEDPAWIDRQLTAARGAPVDVDTLLTRRQREQEAAWARFQERHPSRVAWLRRELAVASEWTHAREGARSEVVRVFWVLRTFALRAGELTGQGDGVFFLELEELLGLLRGDTAPLAFVPARREIHARYRALPVSPTLIRGRFDPFLWAADPRRRADLFDARGESAPVGEAITGFPGAAGIVEGRVRLLGSPEQGAQLQPGEILVTTVTNVGWTPLFPRAAAIVTDVGAPLSHAAIVARELGLPAVVGCGNATMRLRTGDRVRVNGSQGRVEVLRPAEPTSPTPRDTGAL